MAILQKPALRKHVKGQGDHMDAWLMSYADLITLLFMLFVIFVSVSVSRHDAGFMNRGEPEHPYIKERSGTLAMGTPFDDAYRTLVGIVATNSADQNIAVEKTQHGLLIDMSAFQFFTDGSATIPAGQMPLLKSLASVLKGKDLAHYSIEVEGHTDDEILPKNSFTNNWELAAMRAARMVTLLIGEGVDPSHLRATSYAGNHPLVPNNDAAGNPILENRMRNQRIVIRVEEVRP